MDLRSIANSVSSTINANEAVSVLRSNGYTIGAGAKQVPGYAAPVSGFAQVQALDGVDLQKLDGLNIQGNIKAIYLRGSLAGALRPDSKGGDIVKRKNGAETWLVVKVLEAWPTWTKAAIVYQGTAN
jgi:hypothetical protein